MFNNYMDEDERQIIEGHLAYKYALMNSLPSDHPYKTVHPFLEATGTGAFIDSAYLISANHILCSGAYGDGEDMMVNIDDGDRIEFYVPGCQNPGQITVRITYSLG